MFACFKAIPISSEFNDCIITALASMHQSLWNGGSCPFFGDFKQTCVKAITWISVQICTIFQLSWPVCTDV